MKYAAMCLLCVMSLRCQRSDIGDPNVAHARQASEGGASGPIVGIGGKCIQRSDQMDTMGGAELELATCDGTGIQTWSLVGNAIVLADGSCLDVPGDDQHDGARLQTWDCNGTDAQSWSWQGTQILSSQGYCVDASGQSSADGTPIIIWSCWGGPNQQWSFNSSSPSPVSSGDGTSGGGTLGGGSSGSGTSGGGPSGSDSSGGGTAGGTSSGNGGLRLVGTYGGAGDPNCPWNPSDDAPLFDRCLNGLSQVLGTSINAYTLYPLWGDENGWGANLDWFLGIMKGLPSASKVVPVVGIKLQLNNTPPQNYDWNDIRGYNDVASGVYDAMWRAVADAAADNGFPTMIVRISYEYNGSFMSDFEGWDATTQAAWRAAFEHAANVLHDQAKVRGTTLYTMLNPCATCSGPVDSSLPDPSTFDILGLDVYSQYWGAGDINDPSVRVAYWNDTYWSMTNHIALAAQLHKPVYFPEIGGGTTTGSDAHWIAEDPVFWPFVADSIHAMRAQGVQFWGMNFWNINAGDANTKFTDDAQPALQSQIQQYIADGTFIGDPLP